MSTSETVLETYRSSPSEQARISDLMEILPKGRATVLEIGARDGYISRLLTRHFSGVTALDLTEPHVPDAPVRCVAGDVRRLQFSDGEFDVVVCTEVLEHIPPRDLPSACRELARVARHEVVIGVPYRQDLRIGRTRCAGCGAKNPPWGHVNSFDEPRLKSLFQPLTPSSTTFVGRTAETTSAVSAWLHDLAGNPLGTYAQDETCVQCGAPLQRPAALSLFQNLCCSAALRLSAWQSARRPPAPSWIHMVFRRDQ